MIANSPRIEEHSSSTVRLRRLPTCPRAHVPGLACLPEPVPWLVSQAGGRLAREAAQAHCQRLDAALASSLWLLGNHTAFTPIKYKSIW